MEKSIFTILAVAIPVGLTLTLLMPVVSLEWIALIPAHVGLVKFRPWTVFTHVIAETNPFSAVINAAIAVLIGRKLEADRSVFAVAVIVGVAVVSSSISFILEGVLLYVFGHYTLFECVYGALPISLAATVAAWQQDPNGKVGGAVPIGWLPTLLLAYSAVVDVAFGTPSPTEAEISSGILFPGSLTPPAFAALVVVWIYLRHFENRTGSAGDPSPQFAFHMMFPMPLRVVVLGVTTFLTPVGKLLGFKVIFDAASVATPASTDSQFDKIIVATTSNIDTTIAPLPDSSIAMADKRRQLALAALQSRLSQVETPATSGDAALQFETAVV